MTLRFEAFEGGEHLERLNLVDVLARYRLEDLGREEFRPDLLLALVQGWIAVRCGLRARLVGSLARLLEVAIPAQHREAEPVNAWRKRKPKISGYFPRLQQGVGNFVNPIRLAQTTAS